MDTMPSQTTAAPAQPTTLSLILRNRGFLACAILLIAFTAAFKGFTTGKVQFAKLALPLKKPLDQLDQRLLSPYQLVAPITLKPEMLDTLGTTEYIQWFMKDGSRHVQGPERAVNLFVTYYTGKPDQVPHIPDVCYRATGFDVVEANVREVNVPGIGKEGVIPVKLLEFERNSLLGKQSRVVLYTFYCNGEFCPDRRDVQSLVGSPFSKHAFFSKIELSFGTDEESLSPETALRATERCLRVLLPVLLRDHYPDWEAAERAAPEGGRGS